MSTRTKNIVIITGLSGAGLSSALKHLEDINYDVFDNMPLSLIDTLINESEPDRKPLAIGLDSRTRGFDPEKILSYAKKHDATLVYMTADENILQKRFTETRRRHPLAKDRPVSAGIKKEQEWLYSLRANSDLTIDTSALSIHDLRHIIEGHFRLKNDGQITITLMSFGFRYGLPREADIIMDVRFLENPHWVPELKPLTGKDQAVGDYIEKDSGFQPFTRNFKTLLLPLMDRYVKEGKSYLTIAIGCTGGRHRSVYSVEVVNKHLSANGIACHVHHRDIDR